MKFAGFEKITAWIERVLLPIGTKIAAQRHLAAVRDGMTFLVPLTVIGGFACLLASPPVPADLEPSNFFFQLLIGWKTWATDNANLLNLPYNLTIGVISLYTVAGVSYRLAKSYDLDGMANALMSIAVFLLVSDAVDFENGTLLMSQLSASYMFSGLVVALATVEVNHLFNRYNLVIKLPEAVPPNVAAPFNVLLPSIANVIGFMLLNSLCHMAMGVGITSIIFAVFQPLISATGSLPSVILIVTITSIFWFFGVHGDNLVGAITTPIITANIALNLEAYMNGDPVTMIYAGSIASVFGGWMTYNAMVIIMAIFCKSGRLKGLVKVSFIPSLFNINEPNVYGIPTVLNIQLFIGVYIAQIVNLVVYWGLASAGLVGKMIIAMPWSTPGLLYSVLGTLDVRTGILWVALLVVDVLIMLPFMLTYDQQLINEENAHEAELNDAGEA